MDKNVDLAACSRLRILRKLAGLSQREVAAKLFMARTCYSAMENGKRAMTYGTACALADILGVDIRYFSDPEDYLFVYLKNRF